MVDTSARPQTVLTTLTDGATLTLDDPANGSYGIRVDTRGRGYRKRPAAIGWAAVGRSHRGIFPYSLHGDKGKSSLNGRHLPAGSYTLTATAYSEGHRRGVELGTLSVSFTVE